MTTARKTLRAIRMYLAPKPSSNSLRQVKIHFWVDGLNEHIDSEKPRGDEPIKYVCMYVTPDFDTTGNDETSLDDTNGNSGVLSSFAIPELSATNDELLMANLLERENFEDDIETEDSEGTAAVFWPATFEFPATLRILLAFVLEWSEDNTAADVINTQVHVAVIKDNNHNF